MLSYALAIAVATSSLVLFLTAFLMSDIHRKDDFLWSGVGLFYALVLWYCARNITGAVLLGQAAATALLVSYSWQTLKLRRAIANPDKATEINSNRFSLLQKITGLFKRNQPTVKPASPSVENPVTPKVTEQEIAIPDTPAKETAKTPAPSPVPPKEVSTDPATEKPAVIKDSAVETEPKLSEAKSLDKVTPDKQASNVESTSSKPSKDVSTQDTEIIKPQAVEPKIVESDNPVVRSTDSAKNIEANTAIPKQLETKTKESADSTGETLKVESDKENVKSKSQTTSDTVKPVKIKPVAKVSPLDSLETVEVAEVLEAAEDSTINLDTDRSNIIEVTTTEINITTEVKTLEQEEDSDFPEK